jgi:fatty-acyl-CoA synthase
MRPEVWDHFKTRFNIPALLEFYGATEGNVSLFNLDGQPGAIGRVPGFSQRSSTSVWSASTSNRNAGARRPTAVHRGKPGEIGEAIGQIAHDARHAYSGYADKAATQKKILTTSSRRATPGSAPAT